MTSLLLSALAASSLVAAYPYDGPAIQLAERNNDGGALNTTDPSTGYDHYTTMYMAYGAKDTKKTCVVKHTEGENDTPHLLAALDECGHKDVEIVFAKDTTYNIWSPFELANLTNVKISLEVGLLPPAPSSLDLD